jgi:hypothetical protein
MLARIGGVVLQVAAVAARMAGVLVIRLARALFVLVGVLLKRVAQRKPATPASTVAPKKDPFPWEPSKSDPFTLEPAKPPQRRLRRVLVRAAALIVILAGLAGASVWVLPRAKGVMADMRKAAEERAAAAEEAAVAKNLETQPTTVPDMSVRQPGDLDLPRASRVNPPAVPAAAAAPTVAAPVPETSAAVARPPEPAPAPEQPLPVIASVAPPRVYSALDQDVVAPVPIYTQQFSALSSALNPSDVITIEFIVNESGTVEIARAKNPPRSIGESLLLATGIQAVKSWQFQPALKDGTPVAFRDLVTFGPN